jgi:hypothetical protein
MSRLPLSPDRVATTGASFWPPQLAALFILRVLAGLDPLVAGFECLVRYITDNTLSNF